MAAAGETVRPADAAEAARIARVIRSAFAQYRGVLEPPSGALALDAAAVRDLLELGGILVCESRRPDRRPACSTGRTPITSTSGGWPSLPAFRGRGLGVRLVAEVEALAAAAGRDRVRLGVRLSLPRNREFFERLGYRQVGLDSHTGSPVPTFAWLEKPVG